VVMPLATNDKGQWFRASAMFARFDSIPIYPENKPRGIVRLGPQQRAIIDLIGAVFARKLGSMLRGRVLDDVIAAAVINAAYESALVPTAVGDCPEGTKYPCPTTGKAVGLFQLHEGGVGRGMTRQARSNPIANAVKISGEFRRVAGGGNGRKCPPGPKVSDLLRQANAAKSVEQLPSVAQWTAAFCAEVECPGSQSEPARRARTANELFGGARVPAVAPVPVPVGVPLAVVSQEQPESGISPTAIGVGLAAVAALALGVGVAVGGGGARRPW